MGLFRRFVEARVVSERFAGGLGWLRRRTCHMVSFCELFEPGRGEETRAGETGKSRPSARQSASVDSGSPLLIGAVGPV